jgi:hypothetical protein
MVWVNGCGCQRAYSYRHCAAEAEMPVAFRSPRPSRPIVLSVSVMTSRIAGYVTRMSGGVGGALSDGRPYPDRRSLAASSEWTNQFTTHSESKKTNTILHLGCAE